LLELVTVALGAAATVVLVVVVVATGELTTGVDATAVLPPTSS